MRKLLPTLSAALLFAASATAAEVKLTGAEIDTLLSDQIVVGVEESANIEQIFQKGGATLYIENGSQSQGRWRVAGDQYCSQWPPSDHWSCYDVLRDGDLVVFVAKSGKRFPTRLKIR